MFKTLWTVLLVAIASRVVFAQTANATTIAGRVIGDGSQPIPGAQLIYTRLADYARTKDGHMVLRAPGFSHSVAVAKDGTFLLSSLPGGRYFICAQGVQPNQAAGCEWDGISVIDVSDGTAVRNLVRTVHDGSIITINVADPNSRIIIPGASQAVVKDRRFFVGTYSTSGHYARATSVSSSATGHVFRIAIPKQQAVRLFIDTELSVVDASGNIVETERPTTLQIIPAGRDQVAVNLMVK